ncbi:hypothetical protein [Rhizobium sp. BG4]|uniref:Pam3-gp28 family putative phage holin n=1 Tax=Rhizobium sp. BG4 TaxID=2613770 RepID=UPI00193E4CFF|nr:hypothetical protein [Rhizobium sp. BG4]QRM46017.1 hypothetical protein F2982_21615 [Rhizobium sp. BG4]
MTLKGMIDRKLVLMVVTPLARAALSALVGYLASKGAPADALEQAVAACGALGVVAFNIGWELVDRKKAEEKGAKLILDQITPSYTSEFLRALVADGEKPAAIVKGLRNSDPPSWAERNGAPL